MKFLLIACCLVSTVAFADLEFRPGDLDNNEYVTYVGRLKQHIAQTYSPSFIQRSGLRTVTLYRNLKAGQGSNAKSLGGHLLGPDMGLSISSSQTAMQMFRPQDCSIFPARGPLAADCNARNREKQRLIAEADSFFLKSFDHEFFHAVDILGLNTSAENSPVSRSWARLNPPGFAYMSSGREYIEQNPDYTQTSKRPPIPHGFVSAYASSAMVEDKAETFSIFVQDPQAFLVRAKQDPILLSKLALVQQMVSQLCSSGACEIPAVFNASH